MYSRTPVPPGERGDGLFGPLRRANRRAKSHSPFFQPGCLACRELKFGDSTKRKSPEKSGSFKRFVAAPLPRAVSPRLPSVSPEKNSAKRMKSVDASWKPGSCSMASTCFQSTLFSRNLDLSASDALKAAIEGLKNDEPKELDVVLDPLPLPIPFEDESSSRLSVDVASNEADAGDVEEPPLPQSPSVVGARLVLSPRSLLATPPPEDPSPLHPQTPPKKPKSAHQLHAMRRKMLRAPPRSRKVHRGLRKGPPPCRARRKRRSLASSGSRSSIGSSAFPLSQSPARSQRSSIGLKSHVRLPTSRCLFTPSPSPKMRQVTTDRREAASPSPVHHGVKEEDLKIKRRMEGLSDLMGVVGHVAAFMVEHLPSQIATKALVRQMEGTKGVTFQEIKRMINDHGTVFIDKLVPYILNRTARKTFKDQSSCKTALVELATLCPEWLQLNRLHTRLLINKEIRSMEVLEKLHAEHESLQRELL